MAQNIQDVISWLGEQAEAGTTGKKVKITYINLYYIFLVMDQKKAQAWLCKRFLFQKL